MISVFENISLKLIFGFSTILVCLFSNTVSSQINIRGKIQKENQPIASANVYITKENSNKILSYSQSNKGGNFTITHTNLSFKDSLVLHIKSLGFAHQFYSIIQNNQYFEIELRDSTSSLPEIKVKSKILVKKNNDTLNYSVEAFKSKQDRSILDVLKKLPGIDVNEQGKIYYNGKAISDFYIDGDNLLDDRYNIATNSIGADLVDKVQVLENHQPIMVLNNTGPSNKVAINLNLKDKAKLKASGRAEIGLGYSDRINHENAIDILVFKNKYKGINSIKENNTGIDYSDEMISHNQQENNNLLERNEITHLLNSGTDGYPSLKKQQYLFNNSFAINANNLFKNEKEVRFRTNIFYLNDQQRIEYKNASTYYLPNDTISYLKSQLTETLNSNFIFQFNINSNKTNQYLNTNFQIKANQQPTYALINFNNENINPQLKENISQFSGELNYISLLPKKYIFEAYGYLNYSNHNETSTIFPGLNKDIFNNNQPYNSLNQLSHSPDLFSNTSLTIRKTKINSQLAFKLGLIANWQDLNSKLNIIQGNGLVNNFLDSFNNTLSRNYQKIFSELKYGWQNQKWTISATLPLSYQYINHTDTGFKSKDSKSNLYFTPSALVRFQYSNSSYLTLGFSSANKIAKAEETFGGYVLKNYLLIENYQSPLMETNSKNFITGFNFRNPVKLLFLNVTAQYSSEQNNTISNSSFYQTLQKKSTLYFNNNTHGYSFMFNISKYIFPIHSTISIRTSVRTNQLIQIQNNLYNQLDILTGNVIATINSKLSDKLAGNYEAMFTNYMSKSTLFQNQQSSQIINQKINLSYIPKENFIINLNAEDYFIKQGQTGSSTNYLFCNASVLFKANKIKTDFTFQLTNLTNNTHYTNLLTEGNSQFQSEYQVRPRMILLKAVFNF